MQSTIYLVFVAVTLLQVSISANCHQGRSIQTLATALQAAGLVGTLKGHGPFTVFAPTDAAFARLPPGMLNNLLRPENKHQLINILQYHVICGRRFTAAQILSMRKPIRLHMLNGRAAAVTSTGSWVKINNANLIATDVQATNGVIHIIDRVLGF